jgi:NADP-dependent 3-hydroxy acid dehydrogenase YdfG
VYCATKAAKMFSEGLRQELAQSMVFALPPLNPDCLATNLMDTITDEDILGKLSNAENDYSNQKILRKHLCSNATEPCEHK